MFRMFYKVDTPKKIALKILLKMRDEFFQKSIEPGKFPSCVWWLTAVNNIIHVLTDGRIINMAALRKATLLDAAVPSEYKFQYPILKAVLSEMGLTINRQIDLENLFFAISHSPGDDNLSFILALI